eukprot:COSAG06_NODE_32642_length_502_cov_6.027295_1_plen_56_part_10
MVLTHMSRELHAGPHGKGCYAVYRSVTLVKSSVTLLGQYDTWSVSRPNLPPFRACE